jgi:hypothetical protein
MVTLNYRHHGAALALTAGLLALPGVAFAAQPPIDPTDGRLVPNPIESSDPGTQWTCRQAGPDVQCVSDLSLTWGSEPGPDDWCAQPLYSVDGHFTRSQTRYYAPDVATGTYLETNRLVHLDIGDSLVALPDQAADEGVRSVLRMTWLSTFTRPGDLDSRVTQKQGIDTYFRAPDGGVFTLDVGQKTTIFADDFDFHGRWDIALGDAGTEFTKVCNALGLE